MSLLVVSKMTEQMSSLVASLQLRSIQTTLVDDVITANGALSTANPYKIVLIGSDIEPSEAIFLIGKIQAMKSRLPVIAMHALICSDHPKPHCAQSLLDKSVIECDAIDSAEIIVLIMHSKVVSQPIADYLKRVRMLVEVANANIDSLLAHGKRFGYLAPDGLNQLYLKLMLLKELNSVLLLNLYEASSFN